MLKIILLLFIFTFPLLASQTNDLVDFKLIKNVLKNDMLQSEVQKKKKNILRTIKKKKKKTQRKYEFPSDEEYWSFFSEYWLVKNAVLIKWDFEKPDYEIEKSFKYFLEEMGVFELKYKILLVNNPEIPHMALPSNAGEVIFILSVPFIRTLDLSKLEISILLFENYLRHNMGFFKKYVQTPELKKKLGTNFYGKKIDKKMFNKVSAKYSKIIFKKGFSFKQQFKVTKKMEAYFKSELKFWNVYYGMLKKIDELVKTNILYKNYVKIFPSPELQLGWLKPNRR